MFNGMKKVLTTVAAIIAVGFATQASAQDVDYYIHIDKDNQYTFINISEFALNSTSKINTNLMAKVEADMAFRTASLNEQPFGLVQLAETKALNAKIENMLAVNYDDLSQTIFASIEADTQTVPAYVSTGTVFAQDDLSNIIFASLQY